MIELKPYQREGVDMMKKRRYIYNADDMGLGKTIQALVAAKELDEESSLDNILVVCPPSVRLSWGDEARKVGFPDRFIMLVGGGKDKVKLGERNLVITGYSQFQDINFKRKLIKEYGHFDLIVLDEAHTLRSNQSQTTQNILGTHGIVHKAKRVWLLSGTPLFNRTMDLFVVLRVLVPEIIAPYQDYYEFGKRYCAGKEDEFGNWDFDGSSNTKELREKLYSSGFMFRREYAEVEDQLDSRKVIHHTRKIPLMETLSDDNIEYLDDMNTPISSRLKTLASLKTKLCADAIRSIVGEKTPKALIIAYHTDALKELAKLLASYHPAVIYGGTSKNDRKKAFNRFQNDPACRLVIGQITTIGTGINGLQENCNMIIFAEGDWTPAKIDQAIGRIDRIGQKASIINVFMLHATGTLEDVTAGTRRSKERAINVLHNNEKERETTMSIEETLQQILETQVKTLEVLNIIGAHYANTSGGKVSVDLPAKETAAEKKKREAAEKRAAKKAEKEAAEKQADGFTTEDILTLLQDTLKEAKDVDREEEVSAKITDIVTAYAEKVSAIPADKVEEVYTKISDVRVTLSEPAEESGPSVADLLG